MFVFTYRIVNRSYRFYLVCCVKHKTLFYRLFRTLFNARLIYHKRFARAYTNLLMWFCCCCELFGVLENERAKKRVDDLFRDFRRLIFNIVEEHLLEQAAYSNATEAAIVAYVEIIIAINWLELLLRSSIISQIILFFFHSVVNMKCSVEYNMHCVWNLFIFTRALQMNFVRVCVCAFLHFAKSSLNFSKWRNYSLLQCYITSPSDWDGRKIPSEWFILTNCYLANINWIYTDLVTDLANLWP